MLWVQPPNLGVAGQVPPDFPAMFTSRSEEWSEARRFTSVVMLRSTSLTGTQPSIADDLLATAVLPRLREWAIPLALDVTGATLVACGDRSSRLATELALVQRIRDLGGQLVFLSLQSPLAKVGRQACDGYGREADFAARIADVVRYAGAMHTHFPDIAIGLIDAMPAKDWAYEEVYRDLVDALRAAGVRLSFLHLDFPLERAALDWSNVRRAEEFVRNELGLPCGLLLVSRTGGATSNVSFRDNVLAGYLAYRAAGGRQDHLVLTSWYRYPNAMLPEDDEAGAPFSNLVRDLARLGGVVERPVGIPMATPVAVAET
jgi:hypothetical protein